MEPDTISDMIGEDQDYLVARLLKKDIKQLVLWKENKLGENANHSLESIVLVVRGDLLKRYPNALIYAINGKPKDGNNGEIVPGLSEYLDPGVSPALRIFPIFKAALPPDLTFFGFPFPDASGKYFVLEEQVSEPRFGLDIEGEEIVPEKWDDLAWSHLGLKDSYGSYIDDSEILELELDDIDGNEIPDLEHTEDANDLEWNENSSSAMKANITMQKPVRIAIHADEMLPENITSC